MCLSPIVLLVAADQYLHPPFSPSWYLLPTFGRDAKLDASSLQRKLWQSLSLGALGNSPGPQTTNDGAWSARPESPASGGGACVCLTAGRGGGDTGLTSCISATRPCQLHPSHIGRRKPTSSAALSLSLLAQKLRPPLPMHPLPPPPRPPPPLGFLRKSAAENSQKVPDVKSLA